MMRFNLFSFKGPAWSSLLINHAENDLNGIFTTYAVSLFIIFFTCPTYSEQKHVYLELSWQLETSIKEPS